MKLHIGCGKKHLPGYKHVDVIPYDHVDIVCDARNLSMVKDNCVSEIYACHVLEHFKREETRIVLQEWARVLRNGGLLRLSVPDFEAIVHEYLAVNNLDQCQGLLYGGQTYDYNFHHVAFDYPHLKGALEISGFSGIERYDWYDFLPDGYDDYSRAYLPHMDFDNGRLMSLNIIALKK